MALGANANIVNIVIRARDQTKAAFAKAKASMTSTKAATGKLNTGLSGLNGGFSKLSSSLSSFGVALGPIGIAAAAAGVAVATFGVIAVKSALGFEKATATIRVGTGATGESLIGLETSLKSVFTAVPASLDNAATAIADLNTRLGLTGEPLKALATQFLNLSRITGTDISSAISSATRVMHDFAVSSEEQSGALDYLFKVSQSTGIEITKLAGNMTQYGGVMRQMGFDINESAALLGKFEKEGVNLQLVLSSLRMGLANFARAGEEPVEALQRVITEIQGMGSTADRNLKAIEIFGSRSGPDMAAAIYEGRFSIEELMATLDASSETINKAAEDTLTFGDKWTLLKNKVTTAIEPLGDILLNVLGNAMAGVSAGFTALQTVIGAVIGVIKGFHDAISSAVSSALAPLKETIDGIREKFQGGIDVLQVFSDITTIVTAGAKLLGQWLGALVSNALTPLVAKLQEGIQMLTNFYDKLGPVKNIIEGVKGIAGSAFDWVSDTAASLKELPPPIEEAKNTLDALNNIEPKAPQAVADAWAMAIKDFQEGTGSYKEAIDGIEEKIAELTEEHMTATDKRKAAIEKEVAILEKEKDTLEELKQTSEDALSSTAKETEAATEKMEEFKVAIGDTTIEFKDAAAEVLKNADAYEKLQDSARKLMDIDWSVFTEFEAALPNIETGIQDMATAFSGLEEVLETNIGELEAVKESVMGISDISAPFMEEGFLNGIKSIGSFAGTLKDAGSAINTFSSLQDVSIEGCANFSMHVHDMVNALQILESQMEDLVPSFEQMGTLTTAIAEGFIGDTKYINETGKAITRVTRIFEGIQEQGEAWDLSAYANMSLRQVRMLLENMGATSEQAAEILSRNGSDIRKELVKLGLESNNADEFLKKLNESSVIMGIRLDINAGKLKLQTEQLVKITDALQPYLEFMRTLNELAALSTLSTDELNNGLNAINDTLINLGTSLSTFDLRPVMESLFGTKITEGDLVKFTGGITTGFTEVMTEYQGQFSALITYVSRLSDAILTLTSSFDALENISESVLADQHKLKEVFKGIADIIANFTLAMGGKEGEWGFAQKLADGMAAMIESTKPLMTYFQDNNAAVVLFNNSLGTFKTTITNVVDTMDMLKDMSEMVLPTVDELGAGFDRAKELVDNFDAALMEHIGLTRGVEYNIYDPERMFDNLFTSIMRFADDWAHIDKEMGNSFETFEEGSKAITDMVSAITSLTEAFQTLADMPLIASEQIVAGFEKIKDTINEVNEGMKAFAAEGLSDLVTYLKSVADMWTDWDEKLGESDDTFGEAVAGITTLVDAITSLIDVQTQLAEINDISTTEWESFFYKLTEHVYNFYEGMAKFGEVGIAALAYNLEGIEKVWTSWIDEMGDSLTSFDDSSIKIGGLTNSVVGLVDAFTSLAEMPIMTADAFSAGMKDMSTNIANFAAALKDNIATIEKALEAVDEAWSDYAGNMKKLVPVFKDATDAINTLAGGIMSVVRSFESLKEVKFEQVFATGFKNLTSATGEFATALKNNIDGLLSSLNALVTAWLVNEKETVGLMRAFCTIANNFIIVIGHAKELQGAFSSMATGSVLAGAGFKNLTKFMNDVIKGIKEIYTTESASYLAQFVIDIGLVITALSLLENAIDTAMSAVHTKIDNTVNNAKSKLSELANIQRSAYAWGAYTIISFADGMHAMEYYIESELIRIAQMIAFYLGVGSNTKLGALSHLTDWPKNLVSTFADGIKKGTPELSKALSALTLPVESLHIPGSYAGLLGGGGNTVTMYNTWNVDSQQDADYAMGELETLLLRKRVL